jgi:hypothetical protein
MKITICASVEKYQRLSEAKDDLEKLGHQVDLPPAELKDGDGNLISAEDYHALRRKVFEKESWVWERKAEAMHLHFGKVVWADAILVYNYTKNDVEHYIGPNTFLEMGLAFHLGKDIFLFNPIPDLNYKEEIIAIKPIILHKDLSKIL